jgi:uncharacterized protein (TIGR02569 family)
VPVPSSGGEGLAFRSGDIVLKRVHDAGEAAWTQTLLSAIEQDGFRVATPIPTTDGRWVCNGWVANEFLPELEPAAPEWHRIVEWGLRFGDAADRARPPSDAALEQRTHRWAIADRVAWDEDEAVLPPAASEVQRALVEQTATGVAQRRVIHGDLAGNVFVDGSGRPVILDVSPYLRPRRYAAAVVIADAVLWNGADLSLATGFAASAEQRDLLARALVFRLVAEQLATDPRHGALLEPYRAVLAALC